MNYGRNTVCDTEVLCDFANAIVLVTAPIIMHLPQLQDLTGPGNFSSAQLMSDTLWKWGSVYRCQQGH